MLIFAFTQTFFSPIYQFDLKILLLPPVHAQKCGLAYVWKTVSASPSLFRYRKEENITPQP